MRENAFGGGSRESCRGDCRAGTYVGGWKLKYIGIDYGDARTGIASTDHSGTLAVAEKAITEYDRDRLVLKIKAEAERLGADTAVLGLPLNMNGSEGPRAELCREFAAKLAEQIEVPVRMWDERQTTVSAAGYLNETDTRGKKRKAVIDAVAAVIILDSYIQWRKNHPGEF